MQQQTEKYSKPMREIERENPYPRTRRMREEQETEKPKGTLQSVIVVQLVLCLLLCGLTFLLYKTSETRFEALKQSYAALFSQDMEKSELQETFRRVSDFVFKPPSLVDTDAETSDTAEPVVTESTEQSYNGAGGEDLLYPDEITSFAPFAVTGKFTVPVDYKRVTSNFGYRENPVTQKYGFHSGIDLAAPTGTPIYAAFDGRVAEVSSSKARGNYFVLEHGNGVRTVYCHCSEIFAEVGANLKSGEVVAAVGATGQTTGPHLHFEIWLGGVRCNPAWILGLYASNDSGR